jgi:L-alanine-DL-glutamate epimerase-like enolase superfamily enzyme
MALLDLQGGGNRLLFKNEFTSSAKGIPINGLIWMGSAENMNEQMLQKLADGYSCIKMKIGAIDFQKEIDLLHKIRLNFDRNKVMLRVDANGAFSNDCDEKLYQLSRLNIHSIEQPIKQGQISKMASLCQSPPLDIALDEELIGINGVDAKQRLLEKIKPQYIIIKPSLLGGFEASMEWINIAESKNIGWWLTSALESNIGLNAIAQWTYKLGVNMHQGLGTGQLYTNNIDSPLYIDKGHLYYGEQNDWDLKPLL